MLMLVTTDSFQSAIDWMYIDSSARRLVVDLETTGLNPYKMDSLCGVAVAVPDGGTIHSFYFPFRHAKGYNLPSDHLPVLLEELLNFDWTGWNSKFDLKMLRKEFLRTGIGDIYPRKFEDVMLAAHLMNENEPNFKLKDTGERYAKYIGYDPGEASAAQKELYKYLSEKQLGGGGDMWKAPSEVVGPYAEQDVILTERLRRMYVPALEKWGLYAMWQEINDYMVVVEKMEERGLALDMVRIEQNAEECEAEAQKCADRIEFLAGFPLNPNSAQVFKGYINILLNEIGKPPIASTEVEVLEELLMDLPEDSPVYQIVDLGIQYRRWKKANGTYYKAFQRFQVKNVVHANLHMTGTISTRFSCSGPNLQAVPRKDEATQPKSKVKEAFVSRPGYWLFQADYKQAEMYIGAHFAKAPYMTELLKQGFDIHKETADKMDAAGLPIIRAVAKRMNFSLLYGIGPKSLAEDIREWTGIKITIAQAQQYINEYIKVHPEMRKMYYDMEKEARENKFIRTITGRVRRYNGMEHHGKNGTKPSPYQKASSNLIQGSVAEVMRIASMELDRQLRSEGIYQELHVHDSIIGECPEGRYDLLERIEQIMCLTHVAGVELAVPLRVDIEIGYRWSELKKVKEFKRDSILQS